MKTGLLLCLCRLLLVYYYTYDWLLMFPTFIFHHTSVPDSDLSEGVDLIFWSSAAVDQSHVNVLVLTHHCFYSKDLN